MYDRRADALITVAVTIGLIVFVFLGLWLF